MTSETSSVAKSGGESGGESVVIARFDSYRHAEHMLASLGHGFRAKARKGGATAVVVRGNPDGSLKVTESRVLSRPAPFTCIRGMSDRMSAAPTRSSPKLARTGPWCWFAARTRRRGRW